MIIAVAVKTRLKPIHSICNALIPRMILKKLEEVDDDNIFRYLIGLEY